MSTPSDLRYEFGQNWLEWSDKHLSEQTLRESREFLASFIRSDDLSGKTFLDIGCGQGLHSLAASRMGAKQIISFDYDPQSVQATKRAREYAGSPENWTVQQGSVLDADFMASLPKADIVHSWGVLHHTGDMWNAVRNAAIPMRPDALLHIALYATEAYFDPPPAYWIDVKRNYVRSGKIGRSIAEWKYIWRFFILRDLRAGRNPLETMRDYAIRGMRFMPNVRDWLGGYPMEFASLPETRAFCEREHGLSLVNVSTGEGCTEFLFCHPGANAQWSEIENRRERVALPGPFIHSEGACFTASLPALAGDADHSDSPRRSRLMLYEDGNLLGFSHALHAEIKSQGRGRFSHWGDTAYFSTSDNSDPNTNGRAYTYCAEY